MSTVKPEALHNARLNVGRALTGAIALIVLAAAIWEACIALGIVGLDRSDGGWDTRDLLLLGASCALFFGGPVLGAAAFTRLAAGLRSGLPAVACATAALVVARYYSFDSYYAPFRQRFSEGGVLPGWWIALLAALVLGSAALSRRDPRLGLVLAGSVMFLAGPTILAAGAGH
jgi:hypothetical protein